MLSIVVHNYQLHMLWRLSTYNFVVCSRNYLSKISQLLLMKYLLCILLLLTTYSRIYNEYYNLCRSQQTENLEVIGRPSRLNRHQKYLPTSKPRECQDLFSCKHINNSQQDTKLESDQPIKFYKPSKCSALLNNYNRSDKIRSHCHSADYYHNFSLANVAVPLFIFPLNLIMHCTSLQLIR